MARNWRISDICRYSHCSHLRCHVQFQFKCNFNLIIKPWKEDRSKNKFNLFIKSEKEDRSKNSFDLIIKYEKENKFKNKLSLL